jgi:hypothetical protein
VQDVNIENKELTDVPEIKGMTVPSAILLNNNDWGFGYFVLDDNSIKVFESSLSKINSSLNRAVIIGQLIIMMR